MIFARKLTIFLNFTCYLPENARILHDNCPKKFFPDFFAERPTPSTPVELFSWNHSRPRARGSGALARNLFWGYKSFLLGEGYKTAQ